MITKLTLLLGLLTGATSTGGGPAESGEEMDVRERLWRWLQLDDDWDPDARLPWEHPREAMKVAHEVLSQGEKRETLELLRAMYLLSAFATEPEEQSKATESILQFMMAEDRGIRATATQTIGVIGAANELPIVVAMLYDPDSMVRHQAVTAVGKLGDESALLALQIWHKQASEADNARPPTEKWIDPAMQNRLEEARQAIRARLNASTD